jgi:hypothetical protein
LASRAIVAMQGIESACTSNCSSRALTDGHFADETEIDPPAVGAVAGIVFSAKSTTLLSECIPSPRNPGLDEIDDELVDLVAQHLLGDGERALIGVAPALHHLRLRPAFSIAWLIALPPPWTRTGCMPT